MRSPAPAASCGSMASPSCSLPVAALSASPAASPAISCCIPGGWKPVVHLFSQSRGKLRCDEALGCFRARHAGPGGALGRRLPRQLSRSAIAWPRAIAAGSRGGAGCRHRRRRRRAAPTRDGRRRRPMPRRSGSCRPTSRSAITASSSSTSRTTSPPPMSCWPSAKAIARSSTSSATPRWAWAPTRARPATSTRWASWRTRRAAPCPRSAHHLPPALHAGHDRRVRRRRSRRSVRSRAPHADPSLARGRGALFENVGQWKRAWYYPKPGEDMHAAVEREAKAVRTRGRHHRCLDPGQDRHPGARRGQAPRTGSTPTPGRSSRSAAAATA